MAGGLEWFKKAVDITNIDGGAKKGPYETMSNNG